MDISKPAEQLLTAILHTLGRSIFEEAEILKEIGKGKRNLEAYRLCDGTKSQADIAKALKLDQGNFSKVVGKWVKVGILFKVRALEGEKLLHVRPIGDVGDKK